jgi:replicative DNA helicase
MIDSVETDPGGVSPDLKKIRRQKAARTGRARIECLPPHSIEAERAVPGCMLLSPGECLGVCIEKLKSGPELFYDLRHRHVYELLVEMHDQREAIDLLTVQQRLKDRNQLEAEGGLAYLSSLPDAVP